MATMSGEIKKILPAGTIVEVLSDINCALVAAKAEVEETDGGVTSTYEKSCVVAARVLNHGSKGTRCYFNYEVGDRVCLIDGGKMSEDEADEWQEIAEEVASHGEEFLIRMCYIAGAFYDDENTHAPAFCEGVRMIEFPDGGYISYNEEDNSLEIEIKAT